jgi:MerR family transcriptional regulator, copper efflux regulator
VQTFTVSQAAERTGWSPRMLRYLESTGLVVPDRSPAGYRRYGVEELGLLRGLADLRRRFGAELNDVAFVVRLRRDPELRAAVDSWLSGATVPAEGASEADWIEWEQRKHERLLVA